MDIALNINRDLNYREKSEDKPFMIALPIKYTECYNDYKTYINKNVNNALKESNLLCELNKPILKTVAKKGLSIRSMLFNQKNVVLQSTQSNNNTQGITVRCTTIEQSKHQRGRKCETCAMMSNRSTCNVNGVTFNKCHGGNCKSKNLIYLAECKQCNKAYIGKTTLPLHNRINGHRASKFDTSNCISTLTDENVLSYHCLVDHNKTQEFTKLYEITILKCVEPLNLLETEHYLINKFKTVRPTGLNIENPLGLSILRTQTDFV